jgi:hypothetical protein
LERASMRGPLVPTTIGVRIRTVALALLLQASAFGLGAQQIKLFLSPNKPVWNVGTFDVTSLTGGAGSDFTGTHEQLSQLALMEIKNANAGWRLDVSRADTLWPAGVRLYVRRNGDGTGTGTITGGTSYQEVTTVNTELFRGTLARKDIPMQFMVTGVSVSGGAGSFSTTVTYTVTVTP